MKITGRLVYDATTWKIEQTSIRILGISLDTTNCWKEFVSSEKHEILIFTYTPYIGVTLVFVHELVHGILARQLSLCSSVG
jgi:hypothetical protein